MTELAKYWFPAKRYGWGWGLPVRWQGWAVLAGYLLALAGGMAAISPHWHVVHFLGYVAVLSVLLLLICWRTGEPPRWRWGGK